MSKPERPKSRQPQKKAPIRVKVDPSGGWTLIPPHCVFELEPDLADVEMLMREEDYEAARDAALFILEECQDMTAAHVLLAKIAEKESNDLNVAQAHYGYVFELTMKWLGDLAMAPMNQAQKINRVSAEAAEGLKRVLEKRGQMDKAAQVAKYLAAWKGQPQRRDSSSARPAVAPAAQKPVDSVHREARPQQAQRPARPPEVRPQANPPAKRSEPAVKQSAGSEPLAEKRPVEPAKPAPQVRAVQPDRIPGQEGASPKRTFSGPKKRRPMAPRPNRKKPGTGEA